MERNGSGGNVLYDNIKNYMRNIHYKAYSFRLSEQTIASIRNLKIQKEKSYNLLFFEMLKKFKSKK